jgi:hypothetical protein
VYRKKIKLAIEFKPVLKKIYMLLLFSVILLAVASIELNARQRIEVDSSTIAAISWEKNTLQVEFHSGNTYEYYNVSELMYKRFLSASSKGRFYNTYIKNAYRFKRIR